MADNDDANPARRSTATSAKNNNTQNSTFASVNKQSALKPLSQSPTSASSFSCATRTNGASASYPPAESHAMTATSSSSSIPTDQPNGNAPETNGASPYGTRSRNRSANTRPNYAEDRDADMDFEYTSTKKAHATAFPAVSQICEADKSSGSNSRRSSNNAPPTATPSAKAVLATASKDHLPGMSSFSINPELPNVTPAPAPSRKRKAPGAAPVNNTPSINVRTTTSTGSSRRAVSTVTGASTRTTNLMTFENCQGYLRNGKLRADDGTVLSVDGKSNLLPLRARQ